MVFAFVGLSVFFTLRRRTQIPRPAGVLFLLATFPWFQFSFSAITSSGTAWINALYLFGFGLSVFFAFNWERNSPGIGLIFFSAVLSAAALFSVGMQIVQWLDLGPFDIWINAPTNRRFSGNLGQPNQLGTLLLLGGLGYFQLYRKEKINSATCIVGLLWILWGVVLTESRTAWLNLALIFLLVHFFWRDQRPKFGTWVIAGLTLFFVAAQAALPEINALLFGKQDEVRALADPARLAIWHASLVQIVHAPLFGWGWGELPEAFLGMPGLPNLSGALSHAHNIALDLLLMNGLLVGSALIAFCAWSFVRVMRKVGNPETLVPVLSCLVLVIHASLEFPLHYAYFLLLFGFYWGVVESHINQRVMTLPKGLALGALTIALAGLVVTARDYFVVERTLHAIQYGRTQSIPIEERQPDLWVLTQWRDRLDFANQPISHQMDEATYQRMKGVVVTTPSPFMYFRLAQHLTESGWTAKAKFWLGAMCTASPQSFIDSLSEHWRELSASNPAYAKVDWHGCPMQSSTVNR